LRAGEAVPTNRRPRRRPLRGHLTLWEKLSLEYGEANHRPGFPSDAERRAAWAWHRDHILARYHHGRRPAAWWDYEAAIARPAELEDEAAALYRAGLLGEAERAAVAAEWRAGFERAQEPGFWLCTGPGEILSGDAARQAHYGDAGIPRSLVRKWTQEHRRGQKVSGRG
jgi:hypothetical protein